MDCEGVSLCTGLTFISAVLVRGLDVSKYSGPLFNYARLVGFFRMNMGQVTRTLQTSALCLTMSSTVFDYGETQDMTGAGAGRPWKTECRVCHTFPRNLLVLTGFWMRLFVRHRSFTSKASPNCSSGPAVD
jgi:hypothetical protein